MKVGGQPRRNHPSILVTVEYGAKGAKEKVEADFGRRRLGLVPAGATSGRDERETPAGEDAGDGEARANRPPRSALPAQPRRKLRHAVKTRRVIWHGEI